MLTMNLLGWKILSRNVEAMFNSRRPPLKGYYIGTLIDFVALSLFEEEFDWSIFIGWVVLKLDVKVNATLAKIVTYLLNKNREGRGGGGFVHFWEIE